ncbi:isochorismatase family protein [uncultured Desulfuromonas sp.]|uniref:isochorismatase family protein n=1 Tax=uncultured Desulfuromonas sp. TaxID=181013 RepID=UPI00261D694E|nr:isochorismatase family protein [uncultured Desulfuromonas sp.]
MTEDLSKFWLSAEKAVLVVVDVQERLVPAMDAIVYARVRKSIGLLLQGAEILQVPVIATEQYPRGLGHTVPELAAACRDGAVEKVSFGCCGDGGFVDRLGAQDRPQVIVTGMEAHVCVYQTVLGLLEGGYNVHLVRDAICSRGKTDFLTGVENAARAGATVTTAEMALFQMLRAAGTPEFKAVSALIKER